MGNGSAYVKTTRREGAHERRGEGGDIIFSVRKSKKGGKKVNDDRWKSSGRTRKQICDNA